MLNRIAIGLASGYASSANFGLKLTFRGTA
jgi:hypothetical protein